MAAEAQGNDEDDDPDDEESLVMVLKSIASMIYQSYLPEVHADTEGERGKYKLRRHRHLSWICHPDLRQRDVLPLQGPGKCASPDHFWLHAYLNLV